MKKYVLALLVVTPLGFQQVRAEDVSASSRFDEYFTVREDATEQNPDFLDPTETVQELLQRLESYAAELHSQIYSLIEFTHHRDSYGHVAEPYNRSRHFGSWIDDHRDDNCYNTRAKVLIRDSSVPVTFRSNGCSVHTGQWADPYAGGLFQRASDIQVDHFVPLKNAYLSGAHKWSGAKRCLYANFLGNNFHLLPVYGPENSAKSDMTPEGYMPPQKSYRCQYLVQWLKVKMIWALGITPPEKDAILQIAEREQCDPQDFIYKSDELLQQRQYMANNQNLCN